VFGIDSMLGASQKLAGLVSNKKEIRANEDGCDPVHEEGAGDAPTG
jgi:hypothetical protein